MSLINPHADSAYIITLISVDNEQYNVFAKTQFEMMGVCKKALAREELIYQVQSLGSIMVASDYIQDNGTNLNFG